MTNTKTTKKTNTTKKGEYIARTFEQVKDEALAKKTQKIGEFEAMSDYEKIAIEIYRELKNRYANKRKVIIDAEYKQTHSQESKLDYYRIQIDDTDKFLPIYLMSKRTDALQIRIAPKYDELVKASKLDKDDIHYHIKQKQIARIRINTNLDNFDMTYNEICAILSKFAKTSDKKEKKATPEKKVVAK